MVTGEDAEAAGVLRQHLGDAELGGEVGDARRRLVPEGLVPARRRQVLLQVVDGVLEPADELAVLGQRGQPLGRDLAQHLDRVAAAALPEPGSSVSKRSRVSGCQDHRRFITSWDRGDSGSGSAARTVNRRRARTGRD